MTKRTETQWLCLETRTKMITANEIPILMDRATAYLVQITDVTLKNLASRTVG